MFCSFLDFSDAFCVLFAPQRRLSADVPHPSRPSLRRGSLLKRKMAPVDPKRCFVMGLKTEVQKNTEMNFSLQTYKSSGGDHFHVQVRRLQGDADNANVLSSSDVSMSITDSRKGSYSVKMKLPIL